MAKKQVLAIESAVIEMSYHADSKAWLIEGHWSASLEVMAFFPRQRKPEPIKCSLKPVADGWAVSDLNNSYSRELIITKKDMRRIVESATVTVWRHSPQQPDERIKTLAKRRELDGVDCPATSLDRCHPDFRQKFDDILVVVQQELPLTA